MIYIKTFEVYYEANYEPGDIVIRKNPSTYNDELFIIVNQEPIRKDQHWIRAFDIGHIGNNAYGVRRGFLMFNTKDGIVGIRRDSFSELGKDDTDMVYNEVKMYNDPDYYVKRYIDIIKEKTGFDLFNSEKFKNWLIQNDVNKYNL